MGKFTDSEEEERMRVADTCHTLDAVERNMAQMPPSIKHRPSAYYNLLNHEVADAEILASIDLAEDERKERYKNKFIVDHNIHVADMNTDQIVEARKLNKALLFFEPFQQKQFCFGNL